MSEWKLRRGNSTYPVGTFDNLLEWARSGRVAADDRVFDPSSGRWSNAADIGDVATALAAAPQVPSSSPSASTDAAKSHEKKPPAPRSLPLAIGLNLLIPGAGYAYMGRFILGLFVFLMIIGSLAVSWLLAVPVWLTLNVVMALDMWILSNKRRADASMPCPQCAELIQRQAKVCRFCRATVAA